jgi:hypothetical protein
MTRVPIKKTSTRWLSFIRQLTTVNYSVVQTIFWDIIHYSVCISDRLIVESQKTAHLEAN